MQHVPLLDIVLNATEAELEKRQNSRAARLLKRAKLHNTVANLDELEYHPERNLDKITIDRFATCENIRTHTNICIIGAAGTGKSFLSRALACKACENGYRTKVISFPVLMRELTHLYKNDMLKYERRMRYYSRFPLLLIDEWFCQNQKSIGCLSSWN